MLSTQKSVLFLFCVASAVLAVPIPQGAGVGAGCDSIFSDTDTTLGDLVQSEGQSLGERLGSSNGGLRRRQGAGIGAGCDAIFSDTDTTVGDLVQSEGQSIGDKLGGKSSGGSGSGSGSGSPPPPPSPPAGPHKRQANGIGYGIEDILQQVPGLGQVAETEGSVVNTIDGDTTNGSAELGQSIGEGELAAGKAIEQATGAQDSYSQGGAHAAAKVRRSPQGNGIGYGIQDIAQAVPGLGQLAETEGSEVNDVDGDTTQGSAELGQAVGEFELNAGKSVETDLGAQDSYSQGGAHAD